MEINKEQVEQLWIYANIHSSAYIGDFLTDGDIGVETGVPKMPENAIEYVIDYFKNNV